ncbi:MAG: NRDE family protein [Chitinophagaceae bacterium]
MCTVSFIKTTQGYQITSNRDEHIARSIALPPQAFLENGYSCYYPVDTAAAGTWFISKSNGDVGVLLNGAFIKHTPKALYKKSRGSILPNIFKEENPLQALQEMDLLEMQPCTIILFLQQRLYQCIWDAQQLHVQLLSTNESHIWSSITIYPPKIIAFKQQEFLKLINSRNELNTDDILQFHKEMALINVSKKYIELMDENMVTVSITTVTVTNHQAVLSYQDCSTNSNYFHSIALHTNAIQDL